MPINFKDAKPKTINAAVKYIVDKLEPEEVAFIEANTPASIHFSLGMALRNGWGLWEEKSPIKTDFKKRFKLFGHGDDLSGLILDAVWAKVNKQDVEASMTKSAAEFCKHWKKNGVDPITGKPYKKS